MGAERHECFRQWRVFLPEECGFRLLWRIETCSGHRLTVVEVRPPVPRSLLNAHQVIGIIEWISTTAHVSTVEGRPQLLVAIELQAEGVSQSGGHELDIRTVRVESDDGPSAFH